MPASPLFPKKPSSWSAEEEKLRDSGLHFRLWRRPTSEVGKTFRLLFVIHGFGEHSGRYEHLCHYLDGASAGSIDGLAAFDLYGHGLSPGNRGSCRSSEDWLAGAEQALQHAQSKLKQMGFHVETQVLGHSFGGLLTVHLNKRGSLKGVRGITLSAPLLELAEKPPWLKVKAGLLIEPILPQLSLKNEIDPNVVSHDESVVFHYSDDPLNHDRITPRGFKEMRSLMDTARGLQTAFVAPLQLILPGADPLVDERVTFKWFQKLDDGTRALRRLDSLPGFRHESFNEVDKAIALEALNAELRRRWS